MIPGAVSRSRELSPAKASEAGFVRGFRDPSWLKEKAGKGFCINYRVEDLKGYDYETVASLLDHVITETDMNDSLFQDIEKALFFFFK